MSEPAMIDRESLIRSHHPQYVDSVIDSTVDLQIERRIGFPVTPPVALRSLYSAGGTLAASYAALQDGYAANVAGGSHHAMPDGGAGYCVLNDLAISAIHLLHHNVIKRLLIVDLDVHQGDGTATCLREVEGAFTFSIHAEKNFPARKPASDFDIALPDRTADDDYLAQLEAGLRQAFAVAQPQFVLVQAGVDPHADDRLGRLSLSDEGLARRDRLVRQFCQRASIPYAATLGGGYDPDVLKLGQRHATSLLVLGGLK